MTKRIDPQLQSAVDTAGLPLDVEQATADRATGAVPSRANIEFLFTQKAAELRSSYEAVIRRRVAAVDRLREEIQKRDPARPPSAFKHLVVSLARVALNQVTGGLAGAATRAVIDRAKHPLLAGFAQAELSMIFDRGVTGGFATGHAPPSRGPHLHPDVAFAYVQTEALEERRRHSEAGVTEIATACLDREGTAAGTGLAILERVIAAVEAAEVTAGDDQYEASFAAWNSFLAQSSGLAPTRSGATNLSKVVDVADHEFAQTNPRMPGVLELELEAGPRDKLSITSARLAGHGSQTLRDTVRDKPIGELGLPIVATVEERPPEGAWYYPDQTPGTVKLPDGRVVVRDASTFREGFTVGRNEDHEYYERDHASPLHARLARAHGDVAKHVFEHELAATTLDKVKG